MEILTLAGFRQDKLIRFTYTTQEQVIIIPMIQFISLLKVCMQAYICTYAFLVCLLILDKKHIYDTRHFPILCAKLKENTHASHFFP